MERRSKFTNRCNTILFDTTKDGNWNEHVQFLKEFALKTLQTSTHGIENVEIDTSSSLELIDKKLFDKFNLRIIVDEINIQLTGFEKIILY